MCSPHKINIAIQSPETTGFSFQTFESYPEFKQWHKSFQDSSHYEIIQGRQNLYFDFDGEISIDELTEAIKKRYEEFKKPIRIDIYSSSDSTKKSYHVIVKGICFKDHTACGQVAKEVIALIGKSDWTSSFDSSVYSSKRNLRILGSRKLNSTRVKVHAGTSFQSDDWKSPFSNDQLFLSLASCVSYCHLVDYGSQQISNRSDQSGSDCISATDALQLVNDILPGVFTMREVRGRTLFLNRKKPAHCPVCERRHDSDNAMVSQRSGKFFFVCMRDTSRSFPLETDEEVVLPLIETGEEVVGKDLSDGKVSAIELFACRVVHRYAFRVY